MHSLVFIYIKDKENYQEKVYDETHNCKGFIEYDSEGFSIGSFDYYIFMEESRHFKMDKDIFTIQEILKSEDKLYKEKGIPILLNGKLYNKYSYLDNLPLHRPEGQEESKSIYQILIENDIKDEYLIAIDCHS